MEAIQEQHEPLSIAMFSNFGVGHTLLVLFDESYHSKTLRIKDSIADDIRKWFKSGGEVPYVLLETETIRIILPANVRYSEQGTFTQRSTRVRLAVPQAGFNRIGSS